MTFKHTQTLLVTALIVLTGCSNQESMGVLDLKTGAKIGQLKISEHQNFVIITPDIHSLPPGLHGFHLHQNSDCSETVQKGQTTLGGAAGSHFKSDPNQTNHLGPWHTKGHAGDLPNLYVDEQGIAQTPIITNKLTIDNFRSGAVIVHANSDNYTDNPKLGGSGSRIACARLAQ